MLSRGKGCHQSNPFQSFRKESLRSSTVQSIIKFSQTVKPTREVEMTAAKSLGNDQEKFMNDTNDGFFWSSHKIQQAPSDGHCLLLTLVSFAKSQLFDCAYYNVANLIDVVWRETIVNVNEYVHFYENNPETTLIRYMDLYLCHKIHDMWYGDIVPMILVNALHLNLVLMNKTDLKPRLIKCRIPHNVDCVMLLKCPNHYNSIVKKDCIWNYDTQSQT